MSEENKIIDIDLSSQTQRKSIRVDGDDNRILMVNTSDLGVLTRLEQAEERMSNIIQKAFDNFAEAEDDIEKAANSLREADEDMRACLDYIFDANVSEICAPEGTMFDPFNGKYRFEIIIEALSNLYGSQLSIEYRKLANKLKSRTGKYTGKK